MFYSQFILAKKGPLGTIWIAAHLERKLRKNQVADTDIGVSVDSILFPDVPIALRLSSHLLLGVVRIYNRKVNYLFDDCSEALLKVKQAFRSAAVDLPPEESKAPYHSITLPEKFDLDDFELADSDIFHGNYVDHHVSLREQITLQDTMEGVSYSTSKFGLDERFGDEDASGLDLDEELFLSKIGNAGDADESANPLASASFRSTSHPEDRATNSETMVDGAGEPSDLMEYAQAPRTPGLVEEPNLSNAKDASACDDHLETEYHLMESTLRENQNDVPHEDKQEVDCCSHDDTLSDAVPQSQHEENALLSSGLVNKETKPQDESPTEGQDEAIGPTSEFTDKIIEASDAPIEEDMPTEIVKEDKTYFLSVDKTNNNQGPNEVVLEKTAAEISVLATAGQQGSEGISSASNGVEVNEQKSCHDGSELTLENQMGSFLETHETQACRKATNVSALNIEAHNKEVGSVTLVSSIEENPEVTKHGDRMSVDADVKSDCAALATCEREEPKKSGEEYCATSNSDQSLKQYRVQEHASNEDVQMATTEADAQVHNTNSQDRLVENLSNSKQSELPVPEKLLSVPEDHIESHINIPLEVSPGDFEGLDECDAESKTAANRKRSFTESTLTEQSLNSAESSRQVRGRKTTESVPDDDDLLSSILVGRRSSVLNVKPTPPLSEVTSMKRTRSAPRSGAPKRKVVMDNPMVLHGDTIRHQLTNTEDIRRVRKKAPCTLPEISMIQKQHMEDEIFLGTILTGVSVELASLHSQAYDLSRIRVCKDDVNGASLETVTEAKLSSHDDKNGASLENSFEPNLASLDDNYVASVETVAGLHSSSPNNENHDNKGPDENNNVIEISEQGVNNELLIVRDNEITDPSENLLNRLEEVNHTSKDVNLSQEPTMPNNDVGPDDSQQELLGTSPINAGSEYPILEPLDSIGHATSDNGDASAAVYELVYTDVDDRQAIARNEVTEKNDDANREGEIELGAKDGNVSDVAQDAAVELVLNAEHGDAELEFNNPSEIYNTACEEQREMGFSHRELEGMLEDGTMNNNENPEHTEAYQPDMTDAEIFRSDLHDRDELTYSADGNDTEFLNVDDDELTEMADDHLPDAEETQYTENTGWSSRTRAVSKYLQTTFSKEAERGGKSLSTDNLLIGKSRKEASRMFFETLVLKTRDYIHVEQKNPYDDITIKPRTRLMKSDF